MIKDIINILEENKTLFNYYKNKNELIIDATNDDIDITNFSLILFRLTNILNSKCSSKGCSSVGQYYIFNDIVVKINLSNYDDNDYNKYDDEMELI